MRAQTDSKIDPLSVSWRYTVGARLFHLKPFEALSYLKSERRKLGATADRIAFACSVKIAALTLALVADSVICFSGIPHRNLSRTSLFLQ